MEFLKQFALPTVPTIPSRLLPRWAEIVGISVSPMINYCSQIHPNDRLPRGLSKKLIPLRFKIVQKIKGNHTPPIHDL